MNIILIIISLVIGFFIKPVSAVDYSSLDPANNEPIYVQSGTPLNAVSLESIISDSPVSQDSNENRQASSLKNELEPVYEMNEEVTVELFNTDANSMETVLTNAKDEKIEVQIDQIDQQGITILIVNPPSQLTPGKYTLEITDQTGSKIEQDFLWGVLAINPNKAIYNPDETADLAMAVLNESGDMICDAKLTLKITDPEGNLTELSTDNKQIIINESVCQSSKLTTIPDYQAFYKTSKTGQYLMELIGETKNGIYTINDSFEVQSNIDFEVERISATRIYPPNSYPMTINIKANQDFKGNVYEEVPASFEIDKAQSNFPDYTIELNGQNTQKIKWSIDLKKGESIKLNYQYKAPNISPQFYLTGPLQFVTLTDLVYKESRQWQIAADATTETITANGNWIVPTNVYSIIIEGWGGGGAGGGLSANRVAGRGGGGAGGQYAKKTITVNPGTTYAVVVGAAGAGSIGTGTNGGDSIFSIGSTQHMVAMGGAGGQSYDAGGVAGVGTTANGIGDTIYRGGSGSNDGGATGGAGGGGAGSTGNGGDASGNTAGVGTSMMGGGGAAGITASDNGGVGITYGAGGGGGGNTDTKTTTDRNGGNGMVGLIKITYTANSPPNTPTNSTPVNGAIGISLNPTFTASAYSDSESDAQSASQWQIATNSNFSSVVWDTGTTTASDTINVGYTLSYSTLYYWRVRYQQTNQGIWSSYSNSGAGTSFTTLAAPPLAPNIPTLSLPTTGTSEVSVTPTFKTVATDANFDNLQYELKICTNSDMNTDCQTFDQTSSNVSWSGQNVGTSAYSSGTTATYVLQSGNSLIKGVTYYWKTRAKDYSGSNIWSSTQGTPNSFVTGSGLAPLIPSLIYPGTDVFFGAGVTYPTIGNLPYSVTSADFNGDGHPDLVTANYSGNNITVFNNNGTGTFAAGTTYPSLGIGPYSITSTDVNGDGKPDLVSANSNGGNITVFTNKYGIGSSTFSAGVTYPTIGANPYSVTSADFNGDGHPDLVTANYSGNNITVFNNNGTGTFAAGTTYPSLGAASVTSADFNGDGHPDLVIANYIGNNITVFTNTGTGIFGTGVTYPTIGTYPRSVISTDVNGDGIPDLITANNGDNTITAFTNTGTGTFGTGVTYPTIGGNPYSVTSVDFNGDGHADLVTVNSNSNNITVFTNNGNGTFAAGTTYPTLGTFPRSITSTDVNGDGKPDLVSANSNSSNITVFTNTYSSNISLTPTFETVTTDTNDDYLQYQIKYCTDSAMSVGCSTFSQVTSNVGWSSQDIGTSAYSSGTTASYVLQVGNSLTEGTTYYWQSQAIDPAGKNEWSGDQSTPFTFTTGVRPDIPILSLPTTGTTDVSLTPTFQTVATDTNSDNLQYKIDICTDSDMTANCQTFDQTSSNVGWSGQNIGTSAYSSGTNATYILQGSNSLAKSTTYYWKTRAKDYSGINAWSSTQSTPNSFVTNSGSVPLVPDLISPGTDTFFSTGVTYPTIGTNPFSVISVDINGDGQNDLITANSGNNNITVLTNNGDGTFGTGVTYPTFGGYPSSVTSTDINGDDHPDLITANYVSNNITVFINTGTGTFGTGVTYPTIGTVPYSVTSADVNGDSKNDLITANYGSPGSITIFTNKYGIGSSTFSAGVTYPTIATSPNSVTSADVNGDGQADLVTANYGTPDSITVFTNKYGIGSSTFSTGVTYPTIGTNPSSVISADVNGDGNPDLVTVNTGGTNITVFTNKYGIGSSTFSIGVTYPTIGSSPVFVISADFNGDGHPDLVTTNQSSNNMTIFTNTGSGTFGIGVTYPTLGANPVSATSADLNGDYKADLIITNSNSHNITVFTNTYSSNISLNPTFITVTTDADSDYLQYQIKYCTNFAMSVGCTTFDQTNSSNGWFNTDVGTSAYSSGTTASFIFSVGNSLTEGTTYYWQSQAIDPAGTNTWSGAQPIPFTFTTGVRPDIPILSLPTTGTTDVSLTPTFQTVATDVNSDNLQYELKICTDSGMTTDCQTFDQTSSNVGWSGQNIGTSAYSSGTTATYTIPVENYLDSNTTYYWKTRAIDYSSTNLWSSTQSTPNSFVTSLVTNFAPSAPYLPYVNNATAASGQPTPVYGLIDHTPAFSAVFDDPDTSDTSSYYQLQVGSDTDWNSAEIWDSTKSSIGSTCNENSRCADVVYGGGTSLVDGSTYYWRIKFWDNSDIGGSWSETQQFSMNNAPTVSLIVLNGDNEINLSEGSSIGVSWVATATDADVYTNLASSTGKIYRSGLGSTCTLDNNNCYQDASCDFYNCSDNSCSVLCSANLYFFTEATDDTSNFASQYYQAWVQVTDSRTEIGSTTSNSTLVDVNTMSGSSTSSLIYGEVFAGSDTGSSNTITTVTNTGNSLINLEITGDYMCTDFPSCGGQTIEPQKQQYNLNTFTYGAGTTLTTSPQVVNIGLSKPTQTPSNSYRDIYWGIGIPDNQGFGNYQGSIEILGY